MSLSPAQPSAGGDDVSLTWLVDALWKHPRLVAGLPLAATLATLLASFVVRPLYTSAVAFVPETRAGSLNLPPAVLGLASQLGIGLGAQPSVGPQFYAELLRSRELRTRILLTPFPQPNAPSDSSALLELLHISGRTAARRLENGLKYIDKLMGINVDLNTSIVHLAVDAPTPLLAQRVARALLKELNLFNLERRQSQAHLRRIFIEGRVAAADSSLRDAETQLQRFYERNRTWQNSPELVFEEQRLRRRLTIDEELATTLRREYETARIEEVNDTPVITVIDPPSLPDRRSRPKRIVWMLTTLIVGVVGGSTLALLWELQRPLVVATRQRLQQVGETFRRWRRGGGGQASEGRWEGRRS